MTSHGPRRFFEWWCYQRANGATGEQNGAAGEQNGAAGEQNGAAGEQNGAAGEQNGVAGEQNGGLARRLPLKSQSGSKVTVKKPVWLEGYR
jgi:hypothetical protein